MHSQQHTDQHPTRRFRQRHGFTIAEVMLSLTVFTMMTLMFAAVFPMAVRGSMYSSNYAQATMLAQHKMDQLRSAGYDKLNSTQLQALGLIDAVNADGSYDFTSVDNLTNSGTTQGYFPLGSTGTITTQDYSTTPAGISASAPAGTLTYVTVTIAWTGGGVSNGSTSVTALISKAAV